jgi:hypothetical protein
MKLGLYVNSHSTFNLKDQVGHIRTCHKFACHHQFFDKNQLVTKYGFFYDNIP